MTKIPGESSSPQQRRPVVPRVNRVVPRGRNTPDGQNSPDNRSAYRGALAQLLMRPSTLPGWTKLSGVKKSAVASVAAAALVFGLVQVAHKLEDEYVQRQVEVSPNFGKQSGLELLKDEIDLDRAAKILNAAHEASDASGYAGKNYEDLFESFVTALRNDLVSRLDRGDVTPIKLLPFSLQDGSIAFDPASVDAFARLCVAAGSGDPVGKETTTARAERLQDHALEDLNRVREANGLSNLSEAGLEQGDVPALGR